MKPYSSPPSTSASGCPLSGFRKTSLSEQTAQALRNAITCGSLRNPLPGEAQLARQFGISRPSLRGALQLLRQEGLILTHKGKRSQIQVHTSHKPSSRHPMVSVISPIPHSRLGLNQHPVLQELHAQLASRGIGWEEVFDARLANPRPAAILKELVRPRPDHCWLAIASTGAMQHWMVSAGIPVLILGSCHDGVELPSIDLNYRAVGWHAAGSIARHGHTHIGLVMRDKPLAGDLASMEGFFDYASQRQLVLKQIIVPSDIRSLYKSLERLLHSPTPLTALMSMRPAYSLALSAWLPAIGKRIPQDISLISRDTHPLIDEGLPHLTRYSSAITDLARKAVRLIETTLHSGQVSLKPTRITPRFIPGTTLDKAPPCS